MKSIFLNFLLAGSIILSVPANASEYNLEARGRGWVDIYGEGFIDESPNNNYIVGGTGLSGDVSSGWYRNWFTFPAYANDIVSASLWLYSPTEFNASQQEAVFSLSLYDGIGFEGLTPYAHAHLYGGPLFAQVTLPSLAAGQYWEIPFSSDGVSLLNSLSNSDHAIRMGGNLTNATHFGYSGWAPASYLAIRTLASAPPAVPEPATWAMMIIGLAAVAAAMRGNKFPERSIRAPCICICAHE